VRTIKEKKLNSSLSQITLGFLGLTLALTYAGVKLLEDRDARRLQRHEQEQWKRRPQMRLF
jgi:hypothetical protein